MPRRKRAKATWSYQAGKKGRNRVRAFEFSPGGDLYIEWHEPRLDEAGRAVVDPASGRVVTRRTRKCLRADGISTYAKAVEKAEEMAALIDKFGGGNVGDDDSAGASQKPVESGLAEAALPAGPVLLGPLLDLYEKEVIPTKDADTQSGNRIAARQFLAFFGRDAVVERVSGAGRPITELGSVRFHEWMNARRTGNIPGFPKHCGRQTVLSNFRFLRAVFEWGTKERDDGASLMIRNPWRKFVPPAEDNPIRSEMTEELHQQLRDAAPNWRMALIMELCRETRRRMNSVRNLQLSDLDSEEGTVTWRGEVDKARKTRTTPLSLRSIDAVRTAMEHRIAEGVASSLWLFPAPRDPSRPVSENSLHGWMNRTRKKLGIKVPRLGYHGEKRAGIRDPRWQQLPPEWREAISGTTFETEKRIYGYVALPAMREALAFLEGGEVAPQAPSPVRRMQKAA